MTAYIYLEKPGTGIFLMREKAKLQKSPGERKKFTLAKRLSNRGSSASSESGGGSASKKLKGKDGKAVDVHQQQPGGDHPMKKPG